MTDAVSAQHAPVISQRQVGVSWETLDEMPLEAVNTFLAGLIGPNEVFLALGQAAGPTISGSEAQQQEQIERVQELDSITARPLIRVMMTTQRMRELVGVLEKTLAAHDRATGAVKEGGRV